MTLTLNYYVSVGKYGITENTNFNFGTDGLATCVGIIAMLNDGTNFCGHMSHAYEPNAAQKEGFITEVQKLLDKTIPKQQVSYLSYCTTDGTKAQKYTVEAIQQWFPNADKVGKKSCVYIDQNGVQTTNESDVKLGKDVSKGEFEVEKK
jgi:hypothetical protein